MARATQTVTEPRDPQQRLALLFGGVLALLGIVDFSGSLVTDDRLLGVFRIPPTVNAVHVSTGLLGLFLGRYPGAGTLFNKLGGVIYLLAFLVGAVARIAGVGRSNWATNALHLLLAVIVGAVGFGVAESRPH